MDLGLKGKRAIVTGGTRGIGRAIVELLIDEGCDIAFCARNRDEVFETHETLRKRGTKIISGAVDVTQSKPFRNWIVKSAEELGGLDILINNAGVNVDNLSLRMKDEEWKKVIDINLTSTFLMCKFAIKKMLKNKKGKIINITSIVGHSGNLGQSNYTASKAGIVAMSKSLAIEYAKKNININCISPGFIKTAMTDKIDDKFKDIIISKIPSARLGEPDDIANAVLFLASNQSDYINGETLHVNGGMYMA